MTTAESIRFSSRKLAFESKSSWISRAFQIHGSKSWPCLTFAQWSSVATPSTSGQSHRPAQKSPGQISPALLKGVKHGEIPERNGYNIYIYIWYTRYIIYTVNGYQYDINMEVSGKYQENHQENHLQMGNWSIDVHCHVSLPEGKTMVKPMILSMGGSTPTTSFLMWAAGHQAFATKTQWRLRSLDTPPARGA